MYSFFIGKKWVKYTKFDELKIFFAIFEICKIKNSV